MLRSATRLLPLALILPLFACQDVQDITAPEDETGGETRQVGTGKGLTLLLTDAPGDFEAAVVTISQVNLQGTGKAVELLDEPFTGDLIELRNEVATLVQGMELPAGSYSQLRLVIDGAYLEVETEGGTRIYASSPDYDGLPAGADVDGTLQMPSMGQSGLKIDLPGGKLDIGEGETIVMLDFDVEESFGHQAGRSGKWVMHPVVKATNVTFGGFVAARLQLGQGLTLPLLNGDTIDLGVFKALLVSAATGDTVQIALTDADNDGVWEAMYKGLVPGQYSLSFVGPAGLLVGFGTTFPIAITVTEKQTTVQLVTITSVALPGAVTATLKADTALVLPAGVALGQFKARLTLSGDTIATEKAFTDADNNATFEATFPNLVPGAYSLTVVPPAGVTATYDVATLPVAITVSTTGATVTQAFILKTAVKAP